MDICFDDLPTVLKINSFFWGGLVFQVFKSTMNPTQKFKKRKRDENVKYFMKTCASALSSVSEKIDEFDAIGVNIAAKLKK